MGGNLFDYYKRLIMIRKANPEIARGDFTRIPLEDTKAGGFLCEWNGSRVTVFHNTGNSFQTISLQGTPAEGLTLISAVIGGDEAEATLSGSELTIGPQTSVVIR